MGDDVFALSTGYWIRQLFQTNFCLQTGSSLQLSSNSCPTYRYSKKRFLHSWRPMNSFLIMPFGLTNASTTFPSLMNGVFKECLQKFVLVFFDVVLVYSSEADHQLHLYQVLQILATHHLYGNSKKCRVGLFLLFKGLTGLPQFNWILLSFCSTLWEYSSVHWPPEEG